MTTPALASDSPEAHACFCRVKVSLAKRGAWDELTALGFEPIAQSCADYLRTARTLAHETDPELCKEIDSMLEEQRQALRGALAQYLVLDPELIEFSDLDAQGVDRVIAALCAPLPALT